MSEQVSPDGERTFAYNGLPSSHIVGETKLLPEGIRNFLYEVGDESFEKDWKKRNDDDNISSGEALIEMIARFTDEEEWVQDEQRNKEYLQMLLRKDKFSSNSLFNHVNTTVLFNNVSMYFVKKILEMRSLGLQISDKPRDTLKMGFWIPPSLEEKKALKDGYAQVYANLNDIRAGMIQEMQLSEVQDPEEVKQKLADISRVIPWGSQVICAVSAGLGTWRHLLYQTADWNIDSELRFVFLHLGYKFKRRYPNSFQDMAVVDKQETLFGFDSVLSSLDAWKNFRIEFKEM